MAARAVRAALEAAATSGHSLHTTVRSRHDVDPKYARAREEWLSTLNLDADQLAALRKSMTDIRVALLVDVVGMERLHAYELAKAEAGRLWTWPHLSEAIFEASEPDDAPAGTVSVSVLVGVTTLDPADAVRSACAEFADRTWSEPAVRTLPTHQFSYWTANARPERGLVRRCSTVQISATSTTSCECGEHTRIGTR